jgi:hypothetical protein
LRQQVALLASVPLTGEAWRPLAEGEVVIVRDGRLVTGSSSTGVSETAIGPYASEARLTGG